MDLKAYIESGIIESYAMGFASSQERREVECLSAIYPEIKAELVRIQSELERYAESIAVAPPSENKQKILAAISKIPQEQVLTSVKMGKEQFNEKPKVIPLKSYYKVAAAASVFLLLGLAYFYQDLKQEYNTLSQEMEKTQLDNTSKLTAIEDSLKQSKLERSILLDQETKSILLAGTPFMPEAKAKIWWNANQQKFILNGDQLPPVKDGKQYQLWAIVDGLPKSMGVLTAGLEITEQQVLAETNIQAFAITIEEEGGSETPTLEAMVVIGNT